MRVFRHSNIIIIAILILMSTFLIGTPLLESNVYPIYIALGVFSIYYFILQTIKKDKIEMDKIDIILGILAFSSMIPLICKTYVSLEGCVNTILKYICIFQLYWITKKECRKNPKYKDVIIHTIIVSIAILCIIGLDEMGGNYLSGFKKIIHYRYIIYDEKRLGSLFAYPNVMAALCVTGIILIVAYIRKCKKIHLKIVYIVIAILMFISMILTYSRLVYMLVFFVMLLYMLILVKKYRILEKIKKKHIIVGISCIAFATLYVIIGLQISVPLEVKEEYQKIFYSVKPETTYQFQFEMKANTQGEEAPSRIIITQKNKYFDDIEKTEVKLGAFSGTKTIQIQTKPETQVLYLNLKTGANANLKINKAYLNGKETILKYKLLPTSIVQKLEGIRLDNKSVWERTTSLYDGLKTAKEHFVCGLGGGAWETIQNKTQSYAYFMKEIHCFLLKNFVEQGIIGLLVGIAIYTYVIKRMVQESKKKETDEKEITILIGLLFLLLHSLFDFDMSFFYILLVFHMLFSVISTNEKTIIKMNYGMQAVIVVSSLIMIYTASIQIYYKKHTQYLKVNKVWTEERIFKTYHTLLPYQKEAKERYYNSMQNSENIEEIQKVLKNILQTEKYDLKNISLENVYSYIKTMYVSKENGNSQEDKKRGNELEFILTYIKNTEEFYRYYPQFQITRLNNLEKIVTLIQQDSFEDSEKFQTQLQREIQRKEKDMLDYEKGRYEQEKVGQYTKQLEELKQKYDKDIEEK